MEKLRRKMILEMKQVLTMISKRATNIMDMTSKSHSLTTFLAKLMSAQRARLNALIGVKSAKQMQKLSGSHQIVAEGEISKKN